MIKNVQQSDGLEEVKVKLNEVIKILVWENPTATVEKVAKEHLTNHNRQIAKTRDELKTTLVEVKTALDSISTANKSAEGCREDVVNFIQKTEADISSYKTSTETTINEFIKKSNTETLNFTDKIQKRIDEANDNVNNKIEKNHKIIDDKFYNFQSKVQAVSDDLKSKIKQFITFYAQVGLHVKELCDGKK